MLRKIFYGAVVALSTLSFYGHANNPKVIAQFSGSPSLGNPLSDGYGATVSIPNPKQLIIGAAGSSLTNAPYAGAVYFYGKDKKSWPTSQPIFTLPNPTGDTYVSSTLIAAREQWLFVPANGTPLTAPPQQKDFSGAILVFKLDNNNQYQQVDTLFNPDGTNPGAIFGFNLSYTGGDWMVAGGVGVDKAYFFKHNSKTDKWEFKQSVSAMDPNNPTFIGYVFPAINGTHALVSQVIPQIPNPISNGMVYAYEFDGTNWNLLQTLQPTNSPKSAKYNVYDSYGEFIAISNDGWAMVSAPHDSELSLTQPNGDVTGAVYFYKFEHGTWKSPAKNAKVFSDQPSTLFGFGLAIDNNVAVIGDCGRTVNNNIFQGAGIVYKRNGNTWNPSPKLLIDPNGRAYDFFGGGGVDANKGLKFLGSDPISTNYIPEGFPGQDANPFNNGRAVLFK